MYRRSHRHSRVNHLFRFTSPKMNTVLTVESSLAFDTCFHLECSGAVKRFEAQPGVPPNRTLFSAELSDAIRVCSRLAKRKN